jgi:hypothetical protein
VYWECDIHQMFMKQFSPLFEHLGVYIDASRSLLLGRLFLLPFSGQESLSRRTDIGI